MRALPGALHGTAIAAEALARLAIARGGMLDDVTADVYMDALASIEPTLVQRACAELQSEERREFETLLPSVGTIKARCEALAREDAARESAAKLLPLPKSDEDGPRYFCLDCQDESSGWRSFYCRGRGRTRVEGEVAGLNRHLPIAQCARVKDHDGHPYVERCHCWAVNPVIARRRQQELVRRSSKATARAAGGER